MAVRCRGQAAINYAKLLAYKDEYEVARLFAGGGFDNSAIGSRRIQVQLQSRAAYRQWQRGLRWDSRRNGRSDRG